MTLQQTKEGEKVDREVSETLSWVQLPATLTQKVCSFVCVTLKTQGMEMVLIVDKSVCPIYISIHYKLPIFFECSPLKLSGIGPAQILVEKHYLLLRELILN